MLSLRKDSHNDRLEPSNARLISDPLDFLAQEHLRQRQVCAMLLTIANDDKPEFRAMGLSLAYLRHDFLLSSADERRGLFPMMRMRCQPEDEIDIIINRLIDDHDDARDQASAVCEVLERALERDLPLTPNDRDILTSFAQKSQRYLILENAIVLRLARVRLSQEDLDQLAEQMSLRRGLSEPYG